MELARAASVGSPPQATPEPSTYVAQVSEMVPGTTPEVARADGLLLCEQILAGDRGADAVDIIRTHFADRAQLDDDQAVVILQAVLADVCPENGWLDRPTWC